MERAHGMDALFLAMETAVLPMHTITVVLHAPRSDRPLDFDAVRRAVTARIGRVPLLWHRPMFISWGLGQPRWVADRNFDIDRHLRWVQLPEGSSLERLDVLVSSIASQPLARDRPLWELTFVDGLADGRTAEVLKLHHAISDGGCTVATFEDALFSKVAAPHDGPRFEAKPSMGQLARSTLRHAARLVFALPGLLRRTIATLRAFRRPEGALEPAKAMQAPRVSFNGRLSPRRSFARAEISFSRLQAIKSTARCSLNDVFLAVCAGALRRYLIAHDELPSTPLVASIPKALGTGPYPRMRGNRVATLFADLATNEPDPRARLFRISARMNAAKSQHTSRGLDWEQWTDSIPPLLFRLPMLIYRRLLRRRRLPQPINLVVSNINGPNRPLDRCGRSVTDVWFVGPLVAGIGLNITGWSYRDALYLGILSCPDLTPDMTALLQGFEPAVEELERAFGVPVAATG